ncbi:MAG: DMT family transporter [Pseudomonadota bacterium]
MTFRDWAWIVILGTAWGGAFFFNEVLLRDLGPLWVGTARVGMGAVAMWIYVIATGRSGVVSGLMLGQLGVHGLLMYGLPFTIYPIGQQVITSGAAGIINAMTPIMIVIVSHFWPGGERATRLKSAGIAVGFLGIVLLTIPALQGQGESALWGLLFVLTAPFCYGLALNYVRRLKGLDPVVMLTWSLTFATLGIGAVALPMEGVPPMLDLSGWAALFVIGVILTALAFVIFYWLLPRVGATSLSTVTFIAPVSAVFLGVAFLDETVDIWKVAGMVTIFVGLLLIDGRIARWFGGGPKPKDQPTG